MPSLGPCASIDLADCAIEPSKTSSTELAASISSSPPLSFGTRPTWSALSATCGPEGRRFRTSLCPTWRRWAGSMSTSPVTISGQSHRDSTARASARSRRLQARPTPMFLICPLSVVFCPFYVVTPKGGAYRQPKTLSDLTLKLDAVGSILGHELSSFESPACRSNVKPPLSAPRGPLQSGVSFVSRLTPGRISSHRRRADHRNLSLGLDLLSIFAESVGSVL